VFFTARPLPFHDAAICDALNRQSPHSFPATVAYDSARGWWLTADIGAKDSKVVIEASGDGGLRSLLEGVARVQCATTFAASVQQLAFEVSLDVLRTGLRRAIDASQATADWTTATRSTLLARAEALWERSGAEHVPTSWIHSDPSPDNVRVNDAGRVVFIDLEDPWYGPILLMGALTLHSLSRRCGWRADEHAARCRPAWRDYVNACGLEPSRHAFDDWLDLALLVRLIRGVEKAAAGPPLLLHEETPRRSRAIAHELQRLLELS